MPNSFRQWQIKFYNSKRWRNVRNKRLQEFGYVCAACGKTVDSKDFIVDHKEEITPSNNSDEWILYNKENHQLLCKPCHNVKTFAKQKKNNSRQIIFDTKGNIIKVTESPPPKKNC